MHEEIEYAEMLEIPVSTVNVVKKNSRRRKNKNQTTENAPSAPKETALPTLPTPLKESVIAQINDKLEDAPTEYSAQDYQNQNYPQENEEYPASSALEISADADLFAESANSDGRLDFDPIPERIDTVRLYSEETKRSFWDRFRFKDREFSLINTQVDGENDHFEGAYWDDGGDYPHDYNTKPSLFHMVLNAEFAAACALCATIFLTNIFMPNSAINTFFRSMSGAENTATDTRTYADFTLSPVISELSDAELNLSPTGILSFTEEGCVYPAADGKVSAVEQEKDGTYRIKIAYSDSFTGVIGGLDYVYYEVGNAVKKNVPVGYSEGETEVQITMYSEGLLLNCFQLTEENCLAWVEEH